ncbi:MAG: hypothetical protein DRG58_06975 [Deltaproteobacteria bacterium]|nr:MAG: hypothetical protein DRG58_06975 [Deltaproteobacteria bacterium]
MRFFKLMLTIMACVGVLGLGPGWAQEIELREPPDSLVKTVPDLLLVRPVTMVGSLVSTSAFLATLPFSYPLGQDLKIATVTVERPWNYTSNRPLGVFVPPRPVLDVIDTRISHIHSEFLGRNNVGGDPLSIR